MLPDVAVTALGKSEPLNHPIRREELLVPSYTRTLLYIFIIVEKLPKVSVIGEPVLIVHEPVCRLASLHVYLPRPSVIVPKGLVNTTLPRHGIVVLGASVGVEEGVNVATVGISVGLNVEKRVGTAPPLQRHPSVLLHVPFPLLLNFSSRGICLSA